MLWLAREVIGSLDTAAPESADSADGGACGFIGHPS